jgi:type I restriction enzyme M protein
MARKIKTDITTPVATAKRHGTQQSLNGAVKSVCDIMRRSNCAGALQYVPELTWILFLRILDEMETREVDEAEALGLRFKASLPKPYRWRDWAAPDSPLRQDKTASVWKFVHEDLLPKLKGLEKSPGATARQKVISEIMSGVDRSRIDSEKNFLDVLDKVHEISTESVDDTHVFTISQVYEGLLLKKGEKGNDGGQYFTPREIIRAMVQVIDPQIGQTVYDPGCGTGGFLAQAYEYMRAQAGDTITGPKLEQLKRRTFYGREKDNAVYPIALANLVLHGIDEPHIWHGNSLSGIASYDGLFQGAPQFFDVVLMNPPFGGKERKETQTPYEYKTGATQVLFLQNVLGSMKKGSQCGIVLDEGVLFRVDAEAFVKTKRKLLEECDVYCIVSLPGGVFTSAGAGVKTNLIFFTKGQETKKIWYYDLSDIKTGKKTPFTLKHFAEFFQLLPKRADSPRSWTVDFSARVQKSLEEAKPHRDEHIQLAASAKELETDLREQKKNKKLTGAQLTELMEKWETTARAAREALAKAETIENAAFDLKAVNPNRITVEDKRTPVQLLDVIATQGREADAALASLRALTAAARDE